MSRFICLAIASLLSGVYAMAQSAAELDTLYLGGDNHVTLLIPAQLADRMVVVPAAGQNSSVEMTDNATGEEAASTPPSQHQTPAATGAKTGGYRVQVFLDNNARTAKNEARARARNISEIFPNYPTYVVYSSPYWRLRVGNFRTHDEADAAAAELSTAFPAYAREIRVVRDRIIVTSE